MCRWKKIYNVHVTKLNIRQYFCDKFCHEYMQKYDYVPAIVRYYAQFCLNNAITARKTYSELVRDYALSEGHFSFPSIRIV